MVIPQIIHQTWKTDSVPEQWATSVIKYKALASEGWEYKLWTDEDNRNLVKDHYNWFLETFDGYKYPIQRADAIRYFILHKYGGVYSDLDIQPRQNFTAFYHLYKHADICLPSTKQGNSFANQIYSNCFMMSAPNCPFWPIVWERLKAPLNKTKWWKPILSKSHYFYILYTTGPGVICDAAEEYTGEIVAIPAQLIQPGVESDTPPVSRPESVVELLRGESWQQSDADVWRACGTLMNNGTWILLGISLFLFVIILCMAVQLSRLRKELAKVSESRWKWKSKAGTP
jgi:mannosyltransferase OCH1-like enzyme